MDGNCHILSVGGPFGRRQCRCSSGPLQGCPRGHFASTLPEQGERRGMGASGANEKDGEPSSFLVCMLQYIAGF